MANNTNIMESTQDAFDTFVGFICAASIALLIGTAYLESRFDSPLSIAITFLLLMFFAQDWLVRFYGRKKVLKKMNINAILFFFIVFFEIAIVYFLLLAFLRMIEMYNPVTLTMIVLANIVKDYSESARTILTGLFYDLQFSYKMGAFAIMSGLWNTVIINNSDYVKKNDVLNIFKGHLANNIIKMFPIFTSWIGVHKARMNYEFKNQTGTLDIPTGKLLRVTVKSLFTKPHYLILPYLFIFHLVFLNYLLGIFILLSVVFFNGKSIWEMQISYLSILILLLLVFALFFLTDYFSSDRKRTHSERIACLCIVFTILLLYFVLPANVLVGCVVVQQICVNIGMSMDKIFDPSVRNVKRNESEGKRLENPQIGGAV